MKGAGLAGFEPDAGVATRDRIHLDTKCGNVEAVDDVCDVIVSFTG